VHPSNPAAGNITEGGAQSRPGSSALDPAATRIRSFATRSCYAHKTHRKRITQSAITASAAVDKAHHAEIYRGPAAAVQAHSVVTASAAVKAHSLIATSADAVKAHPLIAASAAAVNAHLIIAASAAVVKAHRL